MALQRFFTSKFSVQTSILIGKYLPPKLGYMFSRSFASILAAFEFTYLSKVIRANQYVANGEVNNHQELVQITRQVLEHTGIYFYDLYHLLNKPAKLETLVPISDSVRDLVKITESDKGLIVVGSHLSNYDLVLRSILSRFDIPAKILSYPNPTGGYQLQNALRMETGIEIIPMADSRFNTELIEYLKGGGIVATGIDRPVPGRKKRHYISFFGHPSPLPIGHISLALAADVPIIATSAIMNPNGKYDLLYSKPIDMTRYKNKLDTIRLNAEIILKEIEGFIRKAPDQWLMFYPVWPDVLEEGR